ncbi:MAG: phosphoribosylformylglycinamidine synthase I [Planctomycetes bacterium]|nr:phosphoribosylformylglycinamidine synthase I [Planctomycetota bacterium]
MSTTRALVLRTAGTNCDAETVRALELSGASVELVHLRRVLAEPARLEEADLVVFPGGFSYGDDVAAGRIFGLELRHGLLEPLCRHVDRGGHVLGICNGFQVLVESGLFEREPGQHELPPRGIALHQNASNRFECRWVTLRAERCAASWLEPGLLIPCPAAHGEGRFVVRDEAVLRRLEARGQIALVYAREDGTTADAYPANPNGSVRSIAGICDPTGRVLGLMPHPERNIDPWHHPHWTRSALSGARTEGEGLEFYRRLVRAAAGTRAAAAVP